MGQCCGPSSETANHVIHTCQQHDHRGSVHSTLHPSFVGQAYARTFANALLRGVGHEGSGEPVHAVLVEVGQQVCLLSSRLG